MCLMGVPRFPVDSAALRLGSYRSALLHGGFGHPATADFGIALKALLVSSRRRMRDWLCCYSTKVRKSNDDVFALGGSAFTTIF